MRKTFIFEDGRMRIDLKQWVRYFPPDISVDVAPSHKDKTVTIRQDVAGQFFARYDHGHQVIICGKETNEIREELGAPYGVYLYRYDPELKAIIVDLSKYLTINRTYEPDSEDKEQTRFTEGPHLEGSRGALRIEKK